MANFATFQSKLTSIMEMLTKSAVVEISRLWEDGFTLVRAKLRRRDNEIEALNRKLVLMENERLTPLLQTTNPSSSSSSTREPQNQLLPLAGDGPKIASVLTMASDQSVKEEADISANHRTPLTSQTEGEQCQPIKSERCESDGRDDGPIITSVLTMASDQSVEEEADISANHRTPLTSQTEGEQRQQLESEHSTRNSSDDDVGNDSLSDDDDSSEDDDDGDSDDSSDDSEDHIDDDDDDDDSSSSSSGDDSDIDVDEEQEEIVVQLEDQDIQVAEQTVESRDRSVSDGARYHKMELNLEPGEVVEGHVSQQWSSVSEGDSDSTESATSLESNQMSQNLDSETLLNQKTLDIYNNSAKTWCSDRFMRENGRGASGKTRASVSLSHAQPRQRMKARNHPNCRSCQFHDYASSKTNASHPRHACLLCNKSFNHTSQRGRHRFQTGDKLFTCYTCGKSFRQIGNFRAHQQTHKYAVFQKTV